MGEFFFVTLLTFFSVCSSVWLQSDRKAWNQIGREEEGRIDWRVSERCPMFSGKESDYKNWRVLLSNWMKLGREKKYTSLEMRRVMQGKALDLVVWLDQEKLMKMEGTEMLLRELEKGHKVSRIHKLGKLKEFYNIKREPKENMADYIRRYERMSRELKTGG